MAGKATPALSQFLILVAHEASDYLGKISAASFFKIEAFDERGAIELAATQINFVPTCAETCYSIRYSRTFAASEGSTRRNTT